MHKQINFNYEEFNSISELTKDDQELLAKAFIATKHSYSPYSNFKVGACARLNNGQIASGANLENASFGVCLCAERNLLANLSMHHLGCHIVTLAITYDSEGNDHPISPCGICRQALFEHESISKSPMRIILAGKTGKVLIILGVESLLPLGFAKGELDVKG